MLASAADRQPPPEAASPPTARFIAIETLVRFHKKPQPLDTLFDKLTARHNLSGRDRSFAMNIIYGVLRHRDYLDLLLTRLLHQPINKLHPTVRQVLYSGLYQIFFLDRTPAPAAVNESVKVARQNRLPKKLCSLINGVLRQSLRQMDALPAPDSETADALPNHPSWMVERWQKSYGTEETGRICRANNTIPPLTLHCNTEQCSPPELIKLFRDNRIHSSAGHFDELAVILQDNSVPIPRLPGYSEGFFQVQDEGAQLLSRLLGPIMRHGNYLDGCAGLGGKTANLIPRISSCTATLAAVEPEAGRQKKFNENIKRLFPQFQINLHKKHLQQFLQTSGRQFDGILLDVPCSGTGVIGRHPDIRWNRQANDIKRNQKLQRELIKAAAARLRPDGILVYGTCSIEKEENDDVIEHALQHCPDLSLTDCSNFLPEAAHRFIDNGCFRCLPSEAIGGFFGARLVRRKHTP